MARVAAFVIALVAAGALSAGSYYAVRSLSDDDGAAEAQRPSLEEIEAAMAADRAKPRLKSEVINGIRVGTDVVEENGYCDRGTAPPQYVDPARAAGTELDVIAQEVLSQEPTQVEVVECGGVLIGTYKLYPLPEGGAVGIGRVRFAPDADRTKALYGAAERIGPVTVGGRKGVLEKPVVPGFDSTTVILHETFGITFVQADLPVDETVKIAASIR